MEEEKCDNCEKLQAEIDGLEDTIKGILSDVDRILYDYKRFN